MTVTYTDGGADSEAATSGDEAAGSSKLVDDKAAGLVPSGLVPDTGGLVPDTGGLVPDTGGSEREAAVWLALIGLGLALQFACRLIGLPDNPTGLWLELAPLASTFSAGVIVVVAVLRLIPAWAGRDLPRFRQSLLVLLSGAVMLAGSMVFKSIVGRLFG